MESNTQIKTTESELSLKDRFKHFKARMGIMRSKHRVEPGLYKIGRPDENSAVYVTANYTLSFDALRSNLHGVSAYILVLNTYGINVWCAAGKGTFGTEELLKQINETSLKDVVKNRTLILPQLGAPGVSAHEVRKESGFKVTYGPVRASDVAAYIENGSVTTEMRRVHFPLKDRAILIPVELSVLYIPLIITSIAFYFIGGWLAVSGVIAAGIGGMVIFPLLLPILPTKNFSVKGGILGLVPAIILGFMQYLKHPELMEWQRIGMALPYILGIPAVTAFLSLNFTGSTTFTSPTGVRKEIYRYTPRMAWTIGSALLITLYFIITT